MKEHQIRPKDLYQKYIHLIEIDAQRFVGKGIKVPCPGCDNKNTRPIFEKQGFIYEHCGKCDSFFCNPRPSFEDMEKFYRDTESSRYWNEVFWPAVEETRRTEIFAPRVKSIIEYCRELKIRPNHILDIGAGNGVFLEEFRKQLPDAEFRAVDPGSNAIKRCREKGFKAYQTTAEQAHQCRQWADLIVSFEVLEHVYDPSEFVGAAFKCLSPGGMVLMTTLNHEGVDLQVLKERSRQVLPPLHINFLSITGFRNLFAKSGFSLIEIDTPGRLDVNILENAFEEGILKKSDLGPFLDWLISQGDHKIKMHFQKFLADFGMSSHVWIWARR